MNEKEYDIPELVRLYLTDSVDEALFEKYTEKKLKDISLSYDDCIKIVANLKKDALTKLFNCIKEKNISETLIKAYIATHNEEIFESTQSSIHNNRRKYKQLADYWIKNLINLSSDDLIKLRYVNTIMHTTFAANISLAIENRVKRQAFDEQIANFKTAILSLAANNYYIFSLAGRFDLDVNDSVLYELEDNEVEKKAEVIKLGAFFNFLSLYVNKSEKIINFRSENEAENYFKSLIDGIEYVLNEKHFIEFTLKEIEIIKAYIGEELKEVSDMGKFIQYSIVEDIKGDVKKPNKISKFIKMLKEDGVNKGCKEGRCENSELTFEDLIIEFGKEENSNRFKDFVFDFIVILIILFSIIGYFFKFTTLYQEDNYEVGEEYSYETSKGDEKTTITIERIKDEKQRK